MTILPQDYDKIFIPINNSWRVTDCHQVDALIHAFGEFTPYGSGFHQIGWLEKTRLFRVYPALLSQTTRHLWVFPLCIGMQERWFDSLEVEIAQKYYIKPIGFDEKAWCCPWLRRWYQRHPESRPTIGGILL